MCPKLGDCVPPRRFRGFSGSLCPRECLVTRICRLSRLGGRPGLESPVLERAKAAALVKRYGCSLPRATRNRTMDIPVEAVAQADRLSLERGAFTRRTAALARSSPPDCSSPSRTRCSSRCTRPRSATLDGCRRRPSWCRTSVSWRTGCESPCSRSLWSSACTSSST